MKVLPYLILTLLILILGTNYSFSQVDNRDIAFNVHVNERQFKWTIDSTFKKYTPSREEVILSKQISLGYVDSLVIHEKSSRLKPIRQKFDDYYRQYVGYINESGDRIIYMNCFCTEFFRSDFDPKEVWIRVHDGGSCFYQIRVNLTNKKCFGLYINGSS